LASCSWSYGVASRKRDCLMEMNQQLRIALIAGTLGKGGAEKQLVYIARTLREIGVNVRVYSLTQGEFYEAALHQAGISVVWFGHHSSVLIRIIKLTFSVFKFHPQYVQACHPFTNLYAVIAARLVGAIDIGALRNNVEYELRENVFWGKWLLVIPRWILTNSFYAKEKLIDLKRTQNILTLPNVIDLMEFDKQRQTSPKNIVFQSERIILVTVARLVTAKRIDRFLKIVASLQSSSPKVRGLIIGDGPERNNLEKLSRQLNLTHETIRFLGYRDDVPEILSQCDIFVLTSDAEGFPNVLLEAMAASLPIVTTPAGDAGRVVEDGITGYVVDFDDIKGFDDRIQTLSKSTVLRQKFGEAGRLRAETLYNADNLAEQLLAMYRKISQKRNI